MGYPQDRAPIAYTQPQSRVSLPESGGFVLMARQEGVRRRLASRRHELVSTPARRVVAIRKCCLTDAGEAHDPGCRRPQQMCGTKTGYATRRAATDIATGMSSDRDSVKPYWCPHCALWHVGHSGEVPPA